jgi:hypothetical protein
MSYLGGYTLYLVQVAYGPVWMLRSYNRSLAEMLTLQHDLEYSRGLPTRVYALAPHTQQRGGQCVSASPTPIPATGCNSHG